MARIAVFGLGYVGITSAVGFAELGHSVSGYDISADKVASLIRGELPIFEEGLQGSLIDSLKANLISFTLETGEALRNADFVFLCVPTPMNPDGSADTSYLEEALFEISRKIQAQTIVVLKSTLPLGTGESIKEKFPNLDNSFAYNPEFLREGTALADFRNPDRIVIGAASQVVADKVADLYKAIKAPKLITGFGEAELIKYASNAFLAVKISFINEIANLAKITNTNVSDVSKGMGLDKRIGNSFLNPGPGWGGSCFPKDSRELVTSARRKGMDLRVLAAAIDANEDVKTNIVEFAKDLVAGDLSGKRIAVWGLSFKANTDDIRDSPSIQIIQRLLEAGAKVTAFDPVVKSTQLDSLKIADSAIDATNDSDLLIVLTEWQQFAQVDAELVCRKMANANVIDTRKILPHALWEKHTSKLLALGGID